MECIRQLLLRSGEALFLLQLLSQHHVTRLVQGFDSNQQQALVQLTFHQLVCSEDGDRLATRLISALMEVKLVWGISIGNFIHRSFKFTHPLRFSLVKSYIICDSDFNLTSCIAPVLYWS